MPRKHQASQAASPVAADRPAIDALYLHVPFCFHKCHYCDFYSLVDAGDSDRQGRFTDALIAELQALAGWYVLRPSTLFVGGGTPTLLPPGQWRRLLDALEQLGVTAGLEEFTVEANPETLSAELMHTLAGGGVNRLSIGAQTFQPRLLEALQRWHEPASVSRAVALAHAACVTNVNLDLIFAIPGQTLADLDADLDAALALAPAHLSCYSLIFEPHTPLHTKMRMGLVQPTPEPLERAMYERVLARLDAAGYDHYEISNWARRPTTEGERRSLLGERRSSSGEPGSEAAGFRCRHNLVYWSNGNWLGAGPSAASHVAGRRWRNAPQLGRYIAESPHPPTLDHEQLPPERQVGERLMLGLRTRAGVPLSWLASALDEQDPRRQAIAAHVREGRLERTDTHLRLSREGLFLADAVIGDLL